MNLIDEYDELMRSPGSVSEAMIDALFDTDKTKHGDNAAILIMQIEKSDKQSDEYKNLLIELATHIVSVTTDAVAEVAQSIVDKGPY